MRASWGAGQWLYGTISPPSAHAGAPFLTGDPVTDEYQHYDFYTFTMGTAASGGTSGVGPAFEYNYGVFPNGQFHVVTPMAFDSPTESPAQFGYADTEIGLKYRFLKEDKKRIANGRHFPADRTAHG